MITDKNSNKYLLFLEGRNLPDKKDERREWSKSFTSGNFKRLLNLKKINIGSNNVLLDDHIKIENTDDITIIGNGALISDLMRNVSSKLGKNISTPNGLEFLNCKNVTIKGDVTFVVNALQGGELSEDFDINNIYPCLFFNNCESINLELSVDGNLGAWHPESLNTPQMDIDKVSRFCMVTISHSKNINILKFNMLKNCGLGEHLTIYDCENVYINNHSSISDGVWSFAKIIKSRNVVSTNGVFKTTSEGNGWDVSGENIKFENLIIDRPVSTEAFDITSEYGIHGGDSDVITFNNIRCNSGTVFGSVNLFPENIHLKTGRVNISNLQHIPVIFDTTTISVANINMEEVIIRGALMKNVSRIVSPTLYRGSYAYVNENPFFRDINRRVLIDDLNCIIGSGIYEGATSIDAAGYLRIINSVFKRERPEDLYNSLIFRDCFGHEGNGILKDDISKSKTVIEVHSCTFDGLNIYLGANIRFFNCEFKNCSFYELLLKNGGYENHYSKFDDCDFVYTNNNSLTESGSFFKVDNLHFYKCGFTGISNNNYGTPVFMASSYKETNRLYIENCIFDLKIISSIIGVRKFVNTENSGFAEISVDIQTLTEIN